MTNDEYCPMTNIRKGECDHCLHGDKTIVNRDGVSDRLPQVLSNFVIAEYPGVCDSCDDDIIVGDHIAVVDIVLDTRSGEVLKKFWAHYGCTQ